MFYSNGLDDENYFNKWDDTEEVNPDEENSGIDETEPTPEQIKIWQEIAFQAMI